MLPFIVCQYAIIILTAFGCLIFFILLERKLLSVFQLRTGPSKVGLLGFSQPLADAVKLLSTVTSSMNFTRVLFSISPLLAVSLSLAVWGCYSMTPSTSSGGLFFLAVVALTVYSPLIAGWSSSSKYAAMGALRAVAQAVSYEISLVLVVIICFMLAGGYNLTWFGGLQGFPLILTIPAIGGVWLLICLVETNRTPFDLTEGESELVSGFNTEYGGGGFAFFFLAEYMWMFFLSCFSAKVWLEADIFFITFVYFFIITRALLPRLRYDVLMFFSWTAVLPLVLVYFWFIFNLTLVVTQS